MRSSTLAALHGVLGTSDVGLWHLDLRRQRLWWCPHTRALHEVGPRYRPRLEAALAFYPPETRPLIERAVAEGAAEGRPFDLVVPLVTAKGRRRWVAVHGRAERRAGRVVRLFGSISDHDARAAQEEQQERLARVVEQMESSAIITDRAGLVVWANPAAQRLTGYSLAEMRGRSPGSLLHGPGTDPEVVARLHEAIAAGRGAEAEILNYRRDGTPYWVHLRISPFLGPEGEGVAGFVGISTPIDARRTAEARAEAELARRREAEALLREVLDSLAAGITVYDREERLVLVNAHYRKVLPLLAPLIAPGMTLEEILFRGIACGQFAPDIGPEDPPERQRAWVARILHLFRNPGPSRERELAEGQWIQLREARSPSGYLVCVRTDITRLKRAEAEIRRRAETDALTGLANREAFFARLDAACAAARRKPEAGGALVVFDLDFFKAINDSLGHEAGDALLRAIAARLSAALRETDLLARLGGDEFALLLPGRWRRPALEALLRRLAAAASAPMEIAGTLLRPSLSFGVARYPADADAPDALYAAADKALYEAKRQGRGRAAFFDRALAQSLHARSWIAARLPAALAGGRITIALQPQRRIADGAHVGFEALARWREDGQAMPPSAFVAAAEEAGLAQALGEEVLAAACRAMQGLIGRGLDPGRVAVNVATAQLLAPGTTERLLGLLARHGIAPQRLEIEVTENVFLDRSRERIRAVLEELRAAGVGVALDDFGTGYASLSHLAAFPITTLKVDRGFIAALPAGGREAQIARSILGLGRELGLETVAEGVETEAQLAALASLGCSTAQGFLIAPPLAPAGAEAWLAARQGPPPACPAAEAAGIAPPSPLALDQPAAAGRL